MHIGIYLKVLMVNVVSLKDIAKRVKPVFSTEANLPPSGSAVPAKSLDWAARQAAAARRKASTASAVEGKTDQKMKVLKNHPLTTLISK
jgi:hypothetical protein